MSEVKWHLMYKNILAELVYIQFWFDIKHVASKECIKQ